jgi:hypothetical protein
MLVAHFLWGQELVRMINILNMNSSLPEEPIRAPVLGSYASSFYWNSSGAVSMVGFGSEKKSSS